MGSEHSFSIVPVNPCNKAFDVDAAKAEDLVEVCAIDIRLDEPELAGKVIRN